MLIVIVLVSVSTFVMLTNVETDGSSAQVTSNGQCGTNATYNIYTDGILEIAGSGEMDQYDTTYAPWYECRENITKIVISDKITKLGTYAFLDCKNVTELIMPITLNSVVSDKYSAFAGCCNIEKINFTCGNGGYGYNYAAYPVSNSWYQNTPWYQSRAVLKEINFADDIKGIGSDAFRELNITSLVLPDSVVHLGNHSFLNCTKLTDLTIPVSLNSYGSRDAYPSFRGCMDVQKVTFTKGNGIPFDYTAFRTHAYNAELAPWNMNPDITKTIVIADDVTELGECMFWGCKIYELTIPISINLDSGDDSPFNLRENKDPNYRTLTKVTITKGSGSGHDYINHPTCCPWNNALSLQTITVEDGVTYIGKYMFHDCHMGNLILQCANTSFGGRSFYNCTITNLTIPISLNATWLDEKNLFFSHTYPAFVMVSNIEKIDFTPGSGYGFDYAAYKGSNCWYQHTPWYQCRSTLKEINFAEGITHIGSDAFRELNLTSLVIPSSVESLGAHAFYNMKKLTSLTVPITLDCVGSSKYTAFEMDHYLSELRYTAGTNGIGHDYSDAFPYWNYPYNDYIRITFDSDIKYIGTNALAGFQFVDAYGQPLESTAANLSGHTFHGTCGPVLYPFWTIPDCT